MKKITFLLTLILSAGSAFAQTAPGSRSRFRLARMLAAR
jgi:hypothetical protein